MIVHHAGSNMRLLRLDLMIGRANCQCLKQQTVPEKPSSVFKLSVTYSRAVRLNP